MLAGYEFEIAHEIHQERLRRAEQTRLRSMVTSYRAAGAGARMINALKRLTPFYLRGKRRPKPITLFAKWINRY